MNRMCEIDRSVGWLPHRFDPERSQIHFALVPRGERGGIPFLSADALANVQQKALMRSDLARPQSLQPLHFVFHSAYCGSTFLANLLDVEGAATALKEPQIMNDLVGWRRRGGNGDDLRAGLNQTLDLLANVSAPGEATIIKPSNVCNELIDPILSERVDVRAILLFAPLSVYLGSLSSKGFWARRWARELLMRQIEHGLPPLGFSGADLIQHTDLEAAAVGWLAQMVEFIRLAKSYEGRIAMLDSERLIRHPAETVLTVLKHFGLRSDDRTIDRIVAERAGLNSKNGEPFDLGERTRLRRETEAAHGDEIAMVASWAQAVAENAALDIAPRCLLTG